MRIIDLPKEIEKYTSKDELKLNDAFKYCKCLYQARKYEQADKVFDKILISHGTFENWLHALHLSLMVGNFPRTDELFEKFLKIFNPSYEERQKIEMEIKKSGDEWKLNKELQLDIFCSLLEQVYRGRTQNTPLEELDDFKKLELHLKLFVIFLFARPEDATPILLNFTEKTLAQKFKLLVELMRKNRKLSGQEMEQALGILDDNALDTFFWIFLAELAFISEEYEISSVLAKNSLTANFHVSKAFLILGNIHLKQKNKNKAFEYLLQYAKLVERPQLEILHFLTSYAAEIEDYSTLLSISDKALKVYPNTNFLKAKVYALFHTKSYNTLIRCVEEYEKAIELDDEILMALANSFAKIRQDEKAVEIITGLIGESPNNWLSHLNIVGSLQRLGYHSKAIFHAAEAYRLNPQEVKAVLNLSAVHKNTGDVDLAMKMVIEALTIQPENSTAWRMLANNLITLHSSSWDYTNFPNGIEQYFTSSLKDKNGYTRLCQQLSDYDWLSTKEYRRKLLNDENSRSKLGLSPRSTFSEFEENISKIPMVALLHSGRSGTGLLHALVDAHPEVYTLPSVYFSEFYNPDVWNKIFSTCPQKMIQNFIQRYKVLFNAQYPNPIPVSHSEIYFFGVKDGLAQLGQDYNQTYILDENEFSKLMKFYLSKCDNVTPSIFFRVLNLVVDQLNNGKVQKKCFFYHIHNPTSLAFLNFSYYEPHAKIVKMVRNPIQSLESWISKSVEKNEYARIPGQIVSILYDFDHPVYSTQPSAAIRLEDLKESPEKTLQALAQWMNIEFCETMMKPTCQGLFWWGDGGERITNPFATRSLTNKIGSIFEEEQVSLLATLLEDVYRKLGYPFIYETYDHQEFDKRLSEGFRFPENVIRDAGEDGVLDKYLLAAIFRLRYKSLVQDKNNIKIIKNLI